MAVDGVGEEPTRGAPPDNGATNGSTFRGPWVWSDIKVRGDLWARIPTAWRATVGGQAISVKWWPGRGSLLPGPPVALIEQRSNGLSPRYQDICNPNCRIQWIVFRFIVGLPFPIDNAVLLIGVSLQHESSSDLGASRGRSPTERGTAQSSHQAFTLTSIHSTGESFSSRSRRGRRKIPA